MRNQKGQFVKGEYSWNKGLKLLNISEKMKGNINALGHKCSKEFKEKISILHKGKFVSQETREKLSKSKMGQNSGESHYRWIKDRTLLQRQIRNDNAYVEWRKKIWLRDNFKCKIANPDCKGRIEAHHILSWRDYPELRYQINNGITLCHAHHPRKRAEEKRLSPYFMELVSVSKSNFV